MRWRLPDGERGSDREATRANTTCESESPVHWRLGAGVEEFVDHAALFLWINRFEFQDRSADPLGVLRWHLLQKEVRRFPIQAGNHNGDLSQSVLFDAHRVPLGLTVCCRCRTSHEPRHFAPDPIQFFRILAAVSGSVATSWVSSSRSEAPLPAKAIFFGSPAPSTFSDSLLSRRARLEARPSRWCLPTAPNGSSTAA